MAELGLVFDEDPERYARARPGYPPEIFAAMRELGGLVAGARVLEVGAGTGQATVGLLAAGAEVTAVEPGPGLAAALRQRFAPAVRVLEPSRAAGVAADRAPRLPSRAERRTLLGQPVDDDHPAMRGLVLTFVVGLDIFVEDGEQPSIEFGDLLRRQVKDETGLGRDGGRASLLQFGVERLEGDQPDVGRRVVASASPCFAEWIVQPPGDARRAVGLLERSALTGADGGRL
jgi:SAM-dependent methyltransferase